VEWSLETTLVTAIKGREQDRNVPEEGCAG